eukprot:TRINITY_DN15022_c0_g1_i1.p1 TRINITY_DN15022_c0_g1~~TRINITY_DN15022_c0_g1_i1.p1  ORF type:complete len:65 (-),score=6.89 TRINITY_DN15022_c0_g1_i1:251-445(-)
MKELAARGIKSKKEVGFAMRFCTFTREQIRDHGASALDLQRPFDELKFCEDNISYIIRESTHKT